MQTAIALRRYSCIKTLIIIFYLLYGSQTHAQLINTENLNLMINFHSGYNLPEYKFTSSITNAYVHSLDFCIYKETVGKNIWERYYNYPGYGLSLFYSTLGNDAVFGREFALTFFYKLYFFLKIVFV